MTNMTSRYLLTFHFEKKKEKKTKPDSNSTTLRVVKTPQFSDVIQYEGEREKGRGGRERERER